MTEMGTATRRQCYLLTTGCVCALLLGLVPGPVSTAAAQSQSGPNWAARLFEADTNNNRRVTWQEAHDAFPELPIETFADLDRNKDGYILKKELRPEKPDTELLANSHTKVMESDRNDDGRVAYTELVLARPGYPRRNFDRLDLDGDGFITENEHRRIDDRESAAQAVRTTKQSSRARQLFRNVLRADANNDGRTTFAEARTRLPKLRRAAFNRMDRNNDNAISTADIRPAP